MKLYTEISPIELAIPASRQGAKRHYGVHPYFTRRPYNVVRDYILHFSREGDRILDPFGGSGITAIEAFLENRHGIQNDINPLANFIAQGVANLAKGSLFGYESALAFLQVKCRGRIQQLSHLNDAELEKVLTQVNLPENTLLPSNSDVSRYHELFSPKHIISLSILREAIDSIADEHARKGMLLAWSATLSKLNKTFLSAEGRADSRGGSSIFSIYRYKIAKEPVELPPWESFYERARNVLKAKSEIDQSIELKRRTGGWSGEFSIYSEDVESLADKFHESVDYIFTDPPYGSHISYLDLSTLWNSWLGFLPTKAIREKELIVGGELNFSETNYVEKLGRSIQACVQMLKHGRWLSVVFQHWNTAYFEAILTSATENGAELRAAVSQVGDPIWSMHKKKNNSVLAGELILTFFKSGNVKTIKKNNSFNVGDVLEGILATVQGEKVYVEYLFNRVIIKAWENSAIQSLNISKDEFMALLEEFGWHYDKRNHYWVKYKPDMLFSMAD